MKFLDGIRKALSPKPEETISIAIADGDMVYFVDDKEMNRFRLDEVREIFAFKRDLFSFDLVCIGFRIDDSGSYFEIDEEMKNYKSCLTELPKYFSSMEKDWFSEVAFPAFATNCTTVWGDRLIPDLWEQE